MLSGHQHATRDRSRAQEVVVLVQDTAFLHDDTPRQKPGMGTVKGKSREESLRQPRGALPPARVT
jgi:hypothetical protein